MAYLSDDSLEWTADVKQRFANDVDLFWQKILTHTSTIESYLQARELTRYNQIREIIKIILQEMEFNIDVHFGIDVRNGQLLTERKDQIEMILSPAHQRYNIKLINHLHMSSRVKQLPKSWSVIKYKFYQPRLIDSMILSYVEKEPDKKEPDKKEPDKKEPDKKEPDKKEPDKKEPDKKEPDKKEPDKKEPDKKEPDKKEPDKKEPDKKEPDNSDIDNSDIDNSDIDNSDIDNSDIENEETIIEITKNDFEYFPVIDIPNSKLNLILFISDDKAQYMIHKRIITKAEFPTLVEDRALWYPKDTTIYTVIDCAVGEYNTMNCIDKIEIYLKSEQPDIIRKPINLLVNEIMMMNNNPLSSVCACARCGYQNKQVSLLVCHCKKTRYCDSICQRAHRSLHKNNCIA
jgi:hypothetical protein